jgi:hypothetical protein
VRGKTKIQQCFQEYKNPDRPIGVKNNILARISSHFHRSING